MFVSECVLLTDVAEIVVPGEIPVAACKIICGL